MAKIRIDAYLHSEKSSMRELGDEHGLKGKALDKFIYALYEVKIPLIVDTKTGEYEIVKSEISE